MVVKFIGVMNLYGVGAYNDSGTQLIAWTYKSTFLHRGAMAPLTPTILRLYSEVIRYKLI